MEAFCPLPNKLPGETIGCFKPILDHAVKSQVDTLTTYSCQDSGPDG